MGTSSGGPPATLARVAHAARERAPADAFGSLPRGFRRRKLPGAGTGSGQGAQAQGDIACLAVAEREARRRRGDAGKELRVGR